MAACPALLRSHVCSVVLRRGARCLATRSQKPNIDLSSRAKLTSLPPKDQDKTWLTRRVEASPVTRKLFLAVTNFLGYGSTKQIAGRRTFAIYKQIAARAPDQEREFWQQVCYLPPTFQSWFTVTNLHVWMLSVRFRALPDTHGRFYEQALIDHFFLDIEDRIRAVMQPPAEPSEPYTFYSSFYVNPNLDDNLDEGNKKRKRAPDSLVTKQMKIFKEQWAGMGLAFDLALVQGDMQMAGAVWRNLLGARGAQGIAYSPPSSPSPYFRRTVNLVGGEVVNVDRVDVNKEERIDDGSGVYDFPPEQADRYLGYPTAMLGLVRYIRKELVRLQTVGDEDIITGDWEQLRFGKVGPP